MTETYHPLNLVEEYRRFKSTPSHDYEKRYASVEEYADQLAERLSEMFTLLLETRANYRNMIIDTGNLSVALASGDGYTATCAPGHLDSLYNRHRKVLGDLSLSS